nr:hypothetical protein [Tanacetum cinerariifolium]
SFKLLLLALLTTASIKLMLLGKLTTAIDVNVVEKPTESEGFEQIIDFLNVNPIKYALTVNPTIYTSCIKQFWATSKVKTVNGNELIQALVDRKKMIVIDTSVRSDLHLEDAKDTECLPAATIFEQLTLMGRNDQDMFDTSILDAEEVVTEKEVSTVDLIPTAGEVVTTAGVKVSTAAITSQISMYEITLAKALIDIKTSKSKMQAELEDEERLARQKEEEANIALIESWDNTQAMMDADYELAARLQEEERRELTIKEKSGLFVELMDKRKKYFARLRAKKIKKLVKGSEKAVEGSSKRAGNDVTIEATPYLLNLQPLLIIRSTKKGGKAFLKSSEQMKTKPVDDMENLLFQTLKIMFEHHVEDNIWKYQQGSAKVLNKKLFDSCRVYCVTTQNMVYYLLVEKMYPFTRNILHQMWNDVRLHVDYEVEMAYDLLRLIRRQISKGYLPG